ncbi:MAG: 4-hydroxy-tetrahydrodipicolinate reductase [Clostridiales bacterium]|nr:4-hydroxy-tetrahydrodipicolinate reductase [Clostridiales bacterium]
MLRILLSGACGRMGRQVAAAAEECGVVIVAGVDVHPQDAPFPVYPSFSLVREDADVIVDFSRPEVLPTLLAYASEKKLPLVLAATGYNAQDLAAIEQASALVPVFRSANMSIGVYVLRVLAHQATQLLPGFDIEIVEKHHNQKADAPSGTAIMLYDAVKSPDSLPIHGRHTRTEKREACEIGLHAVRGGTVAGEHEVGFYGKGESVLLTHSAQDRSIFAFGALRAARFIQGKPAGAYDMESLAREMLANQ